METTHPVIETATAPIVEFNDRAGIAYRDELTAEFLARTLAQQVEPHLFTSMRMATDRVLFTGPDAYEVDVELTDGIEYMITGTTASTPLWRLGVRNVVGFASYDLAAGTVTVEVMS